MSVYVVGLTGQSGAGKTTVAKVFADCGFYIIDCDKVARRVTEPGTESALELERKFPRFFENGILNRKLAAKLLFSDRELLDRYNSVIFPFINDTILREIDIAEKNGESIVLLDAPTLFEAGANKLCNIIVSCIADSKTRVRRIMSRDGITEQLALDRLASQHSDEFFKDNSEYIIENNKTLEDTIAAARQTAEKIKESANVS